MWLNQWHYGSLLIVGLTCQLKRYQQRVLINKKCGKRTSNGVCVCACVCVCFLLLSLKLSLRCLFSPHHVNQGGVQKSTPQVTCTRPTMVKCHLGDAELAGTARWLCLPIKALLRLY
jgi:hypothetical protein